MSQKYPYTIRRDDFQSRKDTYEDSYLRQSSAYRPSVGSLSREQTRPTTSSNRTVDTPVRLPGALSFLYSCGLDSSDIAHLAEIPEHLFTVETLSSLLSQIKEHKLSSSSPSPSTRTYNTSSRSLAGSNHTTCIEFPIDRPAPPVNSFPANHVKTWQDRWGNPRQGSSSKSSSSSSSVSDYIVSKNTNRYYGAIESPGSSSRSFVDGRPRPLLSLKLEPPVIGPNRKESSDFHCKIPQAFPHVCRLCDISIRSTKDWCSHVRGNQHVKSQLDLLNKYPKWAQTVEFGGRNESVEVHKVPTRTEASDFNGVIPPVFPYLCVLCNITVFSEKDWSVHITGGQHAQSQLDLMSKYPEWDGTVRSSRRNDGHPSTDVRDGTSRENASGMMMSQEKNKQCSRVERMRSSSPRRRCSSDRTRSSPKRKRSPERTRSSTKKRRSSERTHSSRSPHVKDGEDSQKSKENASTSLHPYHSSSSTAKAKTTKSSADAQEKKSMSNKNVQSMNLGSGLELIADDAEVLAPESTTSDQENLTSEPKDVTDLHTKEDDVKTGDDFPNAESSEASNSPKEDKKFEEEHHDCHNILEYCVTLDEFMEEYSSDCQESGETKDLIPKSEQSDKESSLPNVESIIKSTAAATEPNISEKLKDNVVQPKEEQGTETVTGDTEKTICKVPEVRNLPNVEECTKETLASCLPEPENKEEKLNVSEVNNVHTVEHNTHTAETENTECKTVSDHDVPPTESLSATSSAGVSEKSQEPTEALAPSTESIKQPETTTDTLGPYEPNVPVDTAKKVHCSSPAHHEKLKKHLNKEKDKAQSNRKKN